MSEIKSKGGTVGLFEGDGIAIGGGGGDEYNIVYGEVSIDGGTYTFTPAESVIYPAKYDAESYQYVADTDKPAVAKAQAGTILAADGVSIAITDRCPVKDGDMDMDAVLLPGTQQGAFAMLRQDVFAFEMI